MSRVHLWRGSKEEDQDVAEYAAMLAFISMSVVGTVRLIGTSPNNVVSATASLIERASSVWQSSGMSMAHA